MKPSNNLENKNPSDTYWRVQLVSGKLQATIGTRCLLQISARYGLFNYLGTYRNIMQFQISC